MLHRGSELHRGRVGEHRDNAPRRAQVQVSAPGPQPSSNTPALAPTRLQAQAWTLAARLWQEWPREKSLGQFPVHERGYGQCFENSFRHSRTGRARVPQTEPRWQSVNHILAARRRAGGQKRTVWIERTVHTVAVRAGRETCRRFSLHKKAAGASSADSFARWFYVTKTPGPRQPDGAVSLLCCQANHHAPKVHAGVDVCMVGVSLTGRPPAWSAQ